MTDSHSRQEPTSEGNPAWVGASRSGLERAPDSRNAGELANRLLESMSPEEIEALGELPPETPASVMWAVCGVAPFLANFLLRNREWLSSLARESYDSPRPFEELSSRLDRAFSAAPGAEPTEILRGFKYYELARITIRDCSPGWLPLARSADTLSEISNLADVLLQKSLAIASAEVAEQAGAPRWQTDAGVVELGFAVLGLGKLGSQELNYSSDVDLVYVYKAPPGETSPAGGDGTELSPGEYFTRVAQRFGALVATSTAEGFLYRIDLDLRPEGSRGNLVISDAALTGYYEVRASTWEKAAFAKARPVAGSLEFGWSVVRSVDPMIFRSAMDYTTVQGITELKQRIEEAHGRSETGFNVKIDSGGIRDIEFIAQSMQLLHGGRVPQLRARSTQDALERLAGAGVLPREEVEELLDSYRFLRRVENRLQMVAERQTHVLANDPESRARMAVSMGDPHYEASDAERFDATLEEHRRRILSFFGAFCNQESGDRIFELFARNAPHLVALDSSRAMIRQLSDSFAREIDESPDAESALNNLDRFIQAVGRRGFYYELLADRPELVGRLGALFGASRFLSNVLASHPRLIEPVFQDPAALIPSREAMHRDLASLVGEEDDEEHVLDALRLFHVRQVLNAGLLDLGEKIDRPAVEQGLTDIAEVCCESALGFSRQWLDQRRALAPEVMDVSSFLIVGMGKLASRELSYGSDLDLIFLFDSPDTGDGSFLEVQEYYVRLTQRFISSLQTSTAEGACYEIDARLRPSGNQGTLVCSLATFRRYHRESSESWERQALLRARPVVGPSSLADAFEAERREILLRPAESDPAAEIHRIRLRMENELAQETSATRNFKTGRGGVLDIENATQYLQLKHASECGELLNCDRLEIQLDRLQKLGHLEDRLHRVLADGWDFLQRLGNRLRIVENRSISDLDQERGNLDALARRMGYPGGGSSGASLLRDYQSHTEAIRAAYLEVLGVEEW